MTTSPSRGRRWVASTAMVGVVLARLAGCTNLPLDGVHSTTAERDLDRLRVVAQVDDVDGYDRSCARSRRCSFGPAWTDSVSVAGGHDGCGTRDNALSRDLRQVTRKPGTRGCVVLSGQLDDPYTGRTLQYRRGADPQPVQVDHVFGLHAAWDRGAAGWPQQRRTDFANDLVNLVTTTATVNESKGDRTPQDWRPPDRAGWCGYARRFVDVALDYDLAVTPGDVRTLRTLLTTCPPP